MSRRTVIVLLAAIALSGCTATGNGGTDAGYRATFATEQGNVTLSLVAADEPGEWRAGLMNRERLPAEGMVFLFPTAAERTFWMKNTSIPLDMIFIRNGQVLNVAEADPQPGASDDALRRYRSDGSARRIIETRQGFSAEHGIGPGTRVWIRP